MHKGGHRPRYVRVQDPPCPATLDNRPSYGPIRPESGPKGAREKVLRKLREWLKLMACSFTVRIRGGPLEGMRWVATSGTSFIRGSYESFKTEAYQRYVEAGDVVYDIGGHVGYYAVVASVLAGERGKVFTFEPRPLNIAYIKKHISVNGLTNIEVIEAAVSDCSGSAKFESRTGTGTGRLSVGGDLEVTTVVLDDLIDGSRYPAPDFLKIDIEGGEVGALRGVERSISSYRPKLLVATHGDEEHRFVLGFLERHNYVFEVLNEDGPRGDTEILAIPRI